MKLLTSNFKLIFTLLTLTFFITSCNDDDLPSDNGGDKAVFNELIGTWLIQESEINGAAVSKESFDCLKTSVAKFTETNYEINYRKKGTGAFSGGCAVTQQLSGTYTVDKDGVIDLNKSKGLTAKLVEGKLMITSKEDNNTQEDVFVNEKDIVNVVLDESNAGDDIKDEPVVESNEFKELKQKLQGVWNLSSFEINGEELTLNSCRLDSFLEFKDDNNKVLITQKKATFTRGDLAKYGVVIGGAGIESIDIIKSVSNGENSDKVTLSTKNTCRFIKESTRIFEFVKDDVLKLKATNIEILLKDDSTIVLTFKNESTNTEGKQVYKKK